MVSNSHTSIAAASAGGVPPAWNRPVHAAQPIRPVPEVVAQGTFLPRPHPDTIVPLSPWNAPHLSTTAPGNARNSGASSNQHFPTRFPVTGADFSLPIDRHAASDHPETTSYLIEHHPHAEIPSVWRPASQYQHVLPVDFTQLNQEPWRPFNTRLDFEVAEFLLQNGLNKAQGTMFFDLVHRIVRNPRQLTLASYEDVQKAWDEAKSVQPAVCILSVYVLSSF